MSMLAHLSSTIFSFVTPTHPPQIYTLSLHDALPISLFAAEDIVILLIRKKGCKDFCVDIGVVTCFIHHNMSTAAGTHGKRLSYGVIRVFRAGQHDFY